MKLLISTLLIPLFLSMAIQANASLLSIHTPAKGATVPIGPLTVTGGAISSNSTLKDCNVQLRTNANSFENVTGVAKNNFTTWSTISNETTPGANEIEAQLKCIKPDGSYLIKHNVHNFTVSAPQNESEPIHANLTNQLVPSNFKNPPANFSRPIQNNLENITGVPPNHKNATVATPNHKNDMILPPHPVVNSSQPSSIIKISGHHKTIHIHFSK